MNNSLLIIPVPLILGFIAGRICPMEHSEELQFRPPGAVFGIVWTLLYLLLGIVWWKNINNHVFNVLMITLLVLLNLWIYIYSCKNSKKGGLYILLLTLMVGLMLYSFDPILWSPFIAWIVFALLLNYSIVQYRF